MFVWEGRHTKASIHFLLPPDFMLYISLCSFMSLAVLPVSCMSPNGSLRVFRNVKRSGIVSFKDVEKNCFLGSLEEHIQQPALDDKLRDYRSGENVAT